MSPEFRLRPLLSEPGPLRLGVQPDCVAGVQTPAFVERRSTWRWGVGRTTVSPEFRLRPLLSVRNPRRPEAVRRVSPEFRLCLCWGSSPGTSTPERLRCRRSLDFGLAERSGHHANRSTAIVRQGRIPRRAESMDVNSTVPGRQGCRSSFRGHQFVLLSSAFLTRK